MCTIYRVQRSRSSSPPDPMDSARSAYNFTLLSRRKLLGAASDARTSGRDSLELRRVVLIQNSMSTATISALTQPLATAPPANTITPVHTQPQPVFQTPCNTTHIKMEARPFTAEEREAEERWLDAVLGELDSDDDFYSDGSVDATNGQDRDVKMDSAEDDGFPNLNLDDFFLLDTPPLPASHAHSYASPPPPYSSSSPPTLPPLPDNYLEDSFDELDDGTEKLSIAALFEIEFDFGSSEKSATVNVNVNLGPIMSGHYPPISPYEFVWPTYDMSASF